MRSSKTPEVTTSVSVRISYYLTIGVWIVFAMVMSVVSVNDRAGRGMWVTFAVAGTFVSTLVTYVWLFCLSSNRKTLRWLLYGLPVMAVLMLACVRVEGVTGSLIPRLRFVWNALPDERLEQMDRPDFESSGVDLSTRSRHDFPQFLGPNRNGCMDGVHLATDWDANPPIEKWRIPIGAGWCSFAAVNGYAVTMEQRGTEELTTCYSIETGELAWFHAIDTRHATVLGGVGPRSTPTIHNGKVYAMGATGIFRCLEGSNGREVWKHHLVEEFGGSIDLDREGIAWGRSGSPLVVDDMVVAPVGGPADQDKVTLVAYDLENGRERWRTGTHQISYSSPMLTTFDGQRQIVMVVQDCVCGFDPVNGRLLWQHPWPGSSTSKANVSQPIAVGENRLFLSKGYSYGAELIEISSENGGGAWNVKSVWTKHNVMKTKFTSAVFKDGFIYGLDDVILECVEVGTGRKQWKKGRYGYGQVLRVGDTLLVQAENGDLVAVDAATTFNELARIPALNDKTWNNLCLFDNFLLLRNDREAVCFEMTVVNQ